MGESQGEREPHLGEKGEIRAGVWRKRMDCTVKEGRSQGEGGKTSKTNFIGEVGESMSG